MPTPVLSNHTIGEVLKHIKVLMQPLTSGINIELRVAQTASKVSLRMDVKLIEQALNNLVSNNIYALEHVEKPFIEIDYRLENDYLFLDVSDNGKGISSEVLDKVFVPIFTTRENDSGIGFTITRNILKMHHASVEVKSKPFEKTVFSIAFKL